MYFVLSVYNNYRALSTASSLQRVFLIYNKNTSHYCTTFSFLLSYEPTLMKLGVNHPKEDLMLQKISQYNHKTQTKSLAALSPRSLYKFRMILKRGKLCTVVVLYFLIIVRFCVYRKYVWEKISYKKCTSLNKCLATTVNDNQ